MDSFPFEGRLSQFLGIQPNQLAETRLEFYKAFTSAEKALGSTKSLDVNEAFVLWAVLKHTGCHKVLELGTHKGASTLFIKQVLYHFNPLFHKLISCDVKRLSPWWIDEKAFTFFEGDAEKLFPNILEDFQIDCLFNDAHPYTLIDKSTKCALDRDLPLLLFHDVGKKVFRADSHILPEETKIRYNCPDDFGGSKFKYGHWERHVMAKYFGREVLTEDFFITKKHKIGIFDSTYGLGVVIKI